MSMFKKKYCKTITECAELKELTPIPHLIIASYIGYRNIPTTHSEDNPSNDKWESKKFNTLMDMLYRSRLRLVDVKNAIKYNTEEYQLFKLKYQLYHDFLVCFMFRLLRDEWFPVEFDAEKWKICNDVVTEVLWRVMKGNQRLNKGCTKASRRYFDNFIISIVKKVTNTKINSPVYYGKMYHRHQFVFREDKHKLFFTGSLKISSWMYNANIYYLIRFYLDMNVQHMLFRCRPNIKLSYKLFKYEDYDKRKTAFDYEEDWRKYSPDVYRPDEHKDE